MRIALWEGLVIAEAFERTDDGTTLGMFGKF